MYTITGKLNQYDARLTSNRNAHLQKAFQKFNNEIIKTEQGLF